MQERIPPHNDEAERSVLGAMMLDKEKLFDILEEIKAEDFYNENHKEIYLAISELAKADSPVDVLTVSEELKKRKALDMIGGRAYIAQLTVDVPSTANAVEYAKIVAEKATIRRMIKISESITEKGYSADMDADEMLNYAESGIFGLSQGHQKSDYSEIQEILLENLRIIDEASQNKDKIVGVPSGFKDLDAKTNGFRKSDLIILAARPAMGKTAFALNIALQSAIKANASVLIFNLEMNKVQLSQRLLSMQARVEMQKLTTGELERKDWDRISIAVDDLNKAQIAIDETPGISMMEIRNKCRRRKASVGLDLIIVDYLQLMNFTGKAESRQQQISELSRAFKLLARELDCPVILLSQLSRAPETRPDHRPLLSDLRESGSIEQDADMVIFLYRDDYYNPNTDKPGVCEVNIAKHRSGPTDKVELAWVPMYTKFSDKAF